MRALEPCGLGLRGRHRRDEAGMGPRQLAAREHGGGGGQTAEREGHLRQGLDLARGEAEPFARVITEPRETEAMVHAPVAELVSERAERGAAGGLARVQRAQATVDLERPGAASGASADCYGASDRVTLAIRRPSVRRVCPAVESDRKGERSRFTRWNRMQHHRANNRRRDTGSQVPSGLAMALLASM